MVVALDNETRLVELAMAGDFESFAALYSRHLDAVYRYIYFRTGHQQDAEDLTEQVFLKAWEALPNYKSVGSYFINWLYRISHNIVVDHHRRQNFMSDDPILNETTLPHQEQESALDKVILAEEMSLLAAAVRQLPDEHQQVIILRFVEGLGHSEISRILDKTEVSCRAIQHRALTALNKILVNLQERG